MNNNLDDFQDILQPIDPLIKETNPYFYADEEMLTILLTEDIQSYLDYIKNKHEQKNKTLQELMQVQEENKQELMQIQEEKEQEIKEQQIKEHEIQKIKNNNYKRHLISNIISNINNLENMLKYQN